MVLRWCATFPLVLVVRTVPFAETVPLSRLPRRTSSRRLSKTLRYRAYLDERLPAAFPRRCAIAPTSTNVFPPPFQDAALSRLLRRTSSRRLSKTLRYRAYFDERLRSSRRLLRRPSSNYSAARLMRTKPGTNRAQPGSLAVRDGGGVWPFRALVFAPRQRCEYAAASQIPSMQGVAEAKSVRHQKTGTKKPPKNRAPKTPVEILQREFPQVFILLSVLRALRGQISSFRLVRVGIVDSAASFSLDTAINPS